MLLLLIITLVKHNLFIALKHPHLNAWSRIDALDEKSHGAPFLLDNRSLATLGIESFDGQLTPTSKVSAHPHLDPETGDLWNFGLARGKETTLTVYHTNKNGVSRIAHEVAIPVSGIVHDFALTPHWLIFVLNPTYVPKFPVKLLLGCEAGYYNQPFWGTLQITLTNHIGDFQLFAQVNHLGLPNAVTAQTK